jgi:DNA-directed RNA polymerase subunit K/omega
LANDKKIVLPDGDGSYMQINLIARRAREINRQRANDLYDENQPDPVDVAANEYDNNLLDYEFRHHLTGTGEDFRAG